MLSRTGLYLSLLCLPIGAFAVEPPGTPKPATGAPGDKSGHNDPFGTQGEKAEEKKSQAEQVSEMRKPMIESISVVGNKRASDSEVLGHLHLHAGDDLDEQAIQVSRIRLLQLGPFEDVQMEVSPGSDSYHYRLVIRVEERNTIFITDLLFGTTTSTHFYAGLGVADADVFGSGLSLSAGGLDGTAGRQSGRFTVYDPDVTVFKQSFVVGGQVIYQRNVENACGNPSCGAMGINLRYTRVGGEVDAGFRPGSYGRILVGYRLERLWGALDNGATAANAPFINVGYSTLSALVVGYDRDARDETFLPTRGSRVQLQMAFSSHAISSDYDYSRYVVQFEQWIPQGGGRALRLDLLGGAVQGNAPFFDRFYAADWSYYSLGLAVSRVLDLNLSPDSRYDVILGAVGAEYDFPLWKTRTFLKRGYLALGARALYTSARAGGPRTDVSKSPLSFDASLRIDSPVGVLSVSLGYLASFFFANLFYR